MSSIFKFSSEGVLTTPRVCERVPKSSLRFQSVAPGCVAISMCNPRVCGDFNVKAKGVHRDHGVARACEMVCNTSLKPENSLIWLGDTSLKPENSLIWLGDPSLKPENSLIWLGDPFPSQKTHFSGRGRRDLILLGGPFASQEHDSSGLAVIAQSGLRPRLGGQAHLKPQHDHSGSAAAFQARKLCHLAWPSLQTIDPHWCSGISQANRLMDMALRLCLEPADRFAWQMSGGVQIQISFSTFSNTCDMVWRHSTRAHTRYLDVWERLFISE